MSCHKTKRADLYFMRKASPTSDELISKMQSQFAEKIGDLVDESFS
jgi:hypothetical protein